MLFPADVATACEMLADHGDAVPMAGGTDLLVNWPERIEQRTVTFVDLWKLDALRTMRWSEGELVLGALATYWDVVMDRRAWAEFPLLIQAARQVGAIQIQARGTWAGNIVNASPAADGVPVLMAYDAIVVLQGQEGTREVPLADFYLGYKELRRRRDELVTAIRLPRRSYDYQIFEKVGSRRAQAITKVGVAITRSDGDWRVVANSVAPTVHRCAAIEKLLAERRAVSGPDDLIPAIRADVSPIDDIRSTAAYREQVMARLLYYDLKEVCDFESEQ